MFSEEKISVEISSLPQCTNPKMICGLPGSGYVGKLAIDFLIDKLKAKKFAEIYSASFPPQVSIQSDGTVDLVKNSIYHCKLGSQDLIFLTGDAQPVSAQGEYALAHEIINLCKKMNIQEIFTLAAYITGKFSKVPDVFGTSTSVEVVKKFDGKEIQRMNKGNITGMNGVIIGIAKKSGIIGTCLLGETSGYVIDPKASKAVLTSLTKFIDIQIDMSELDQRAKETEELINVLRAQGNVPGVSEPMQLKSSSDEKNLGYIS